MMIENNKVWKSIRMGEVCKVIAGQSPEGKFYNIDGDGMPFYQGKKEFTEKYIGPPTTWTTKVTKEANENDILMSVRAPVGPVNFSTEKICIGRGLAAIRASSLIDKEYLFNFLLKYENEIVGNSGAVFNSINKSQIEDILIPLPSLKEQQRIVAILDEAFAAIDKAKANAERNLKNAKELFESCLQEVLGNKGHGWKKSRIEDVCESIIDCVNKTAPLADVETPFKMIRTTNIRFGLVDLSSVRYVTEAVYLDWTRRQKPKFGDILFTREAPMGEVGMLLSHDNVFLGQRIVSYRVDQGRLLGKFLLYAFQSKSLKDQITRLASGATVQHLRVPHTKSFIFDIPSLDEQRLIIEKLDFVSSECKRLEAIYQTKLEHLEELKKSLLQKAFSGELTALKPTVKVIELPAKYTTISPIDLQAGIVAYALQRHLEANKANTFKHVKAEKIVHLAEQILNIDLERNPVKDAAGPNDFPHAKKVEFRAEKVGYFNVHKTEIGYEYIPGNQIQSIINKTQTVLETRVDKLKWLVDLLVPMTTQQAEIIATVYAAWNNLLLNKLNITDEAIVAEARENWHPDKLKIEREKFFNAIGWMNKVGLVPTGNGKQVSAKATK